MHWITSWALVLGLIICTTPPSSTLVTPPVQGPGMGTFHRTQSETVLNKVDEQGTSWQSLRGWGSRFRCNMTWMAESKHVRFSGPNIFSYNLDWLIWYGWIMPSEASFIHNKRMFLTQVVLMMVASILAYFKCPDKSVTRIRNFCIPLSENYSALTLITVSSFIITTITSITISRWWTTRTHVNAVGGRMKNIAMLLASSTAGGGPAVAAAVGHAIRLLNLAHSIMYRLANGPITREVLAPLTAEGLCTPAEARLIWSCADPLAVIYGWVCMLVRDMHHDHAAFAENTLQTLQMQVAELRNNAGDTLLYIHTQLPYAAVQLISVVVFSFLLQLIMVSAGVIGAGLQAKDWASVFLGYFTLALVSFIYLGLLNLHSEVANPLGDDPCDFPTLAYQEGLAAATDAIRRLVPLSPAAAQIPTAAAAAAAVAAEAAAAAADGAGAGAGAEAAGVDGRGEGGGVGAAEAEGSPSVPPPPPPPPSAPAQPMRLRSSSPAPAA